MSCFSLMYIQFSGFRLHVIHNFSIIIHSSCLLFVLFVTAGKQTLWNRLVSHTGGKYLGVHIRPVHMAHGLSWSHKRCSVAHRDRLEQSSANRRCIKKNKVGQQMIFENQVLDLSKTTSCSEGSGVYIWNKPCLIENNRNNDWRCSKLCEKDNSIYSRESWKRLLQLFWV